jgi:hypothetical protein
MRAGALYLLILGLLFLILSALFTINVFLKSKTDILDDEAPVRGVGAKVSETPDSVWNRFVSEKVIVKDYYPANEIILSWDLVEADKLKDTLYKVAFENLDKYQYFCLNQVLNNHNVRRSIEKVNDTYHVILSLYSPAAADVLMQELAEYDIQGNISKYKSEIKYNQ